MRIIYTVFICIFLVGCASTESKYKSEPPDQHSEDNYKVHYDLSQQQSKNTDFTNLRLSFTKTNNYKPYKVARRNELLALIQSGQYIECIEMAETDLEKEYVNIIAHYSAMVCHTETGDTSRGDYHKFVMTGLLRYIANSGDGKTTDSAYQIISTDELYTFLYFNRLNATKQQLVNAGGRMFDRMEVEHEKSKNEYTIYFDITPQILWMAEQT